MGGECPYHGCDLIQEERGDAYRCSCKTDLKNGNEYYTFEDYVKDCPKNVEEDDWRNRWDDEDELDSCEHFKHSKESYDAGKGDQDYHEIADMGY